MFKTNFSERNKIWGHKKDFGVTASECPPRVCGPGQNRRQKVFHWGRLCLYRGLALDILKL